MKRKIISSACLFIVLTLIMSACLILSNSDNSLIIAEKGEQLVQLNEIRQRVKNGDDIEVIDEKISLLEDSIRESSYSMNKNNSDLYIFTAVSILFIIIIFAYIYQSILKPFTKMEKYVGEIANGNFDIQLDYDRSNYFGKFTWAFDCMRKEIINARSCEKEAIENNKTVIATLSHDIKTPVASIKAYAEGLEANLDSTPEKRARYLNTIIKKCDEVSKLTNDLFLHSLSDLDMLRINSEEFELCSFLQETISDISADSKIKFINPNFTVNIFADKKRVTQILENIINNSEKYAKSEVEISLATKGDDVNIHIRDYGTGIPDTDMPFIINKFYRGKNCGNEQGSGLGLYIVNYLCNHMNGNMCLHNLDHGLEVIITFPIFYKKHDF